PGWPAPPRALRRPRSPTRPRRRPKARRRAASSGRAWPARELAAAVGELRLARFPRLSGASGDRKRVVERNAAMDARFASFLLLLPAACEAAPTPPQASASASTQARGDALSVGSEAVAAIGKV